MINIENITRREEDKKSKIKRTEDLLNKFFGDVYLDVTPTSIFVREDRGSDPLEDLGSNPFLSVQTASDKITLSIPESSIPKYYEKTLAFAREYEEIFNLKKVTLQTDYSKR